MIQIQPAGDLRGYTRENYLKRFPNAAGIEAASVLCVGFSDEQVQEWVMPFKPRRVIRLTYWDGHVDAQQGAFELVRGDICRRTPIAENTFDWVLTSSVFEHLGNIEGACAEIKRLLKPDGFVGIEFGPVWSSSNGHHLYIDPGNPHLDFTQWKLPSHWHLQFFSEDIKNYFTLVGKSAQLDMIHQSVFTSRIINRFMWEDYMDVFERHFGNPVFKEVLQSDVNPELLAYLRKVYEPYSDFESEGGNFIFSMENSR